jgi:glutamine cyclotransferase
MPAAARRVNGSRGVALDSGAVAVAAPRTALLPPAPGPRVLSATLGLLIFFGGMLILRLTGAGGAAASALARSWSSGARGPARGRGGDNDAAPARPPPASAPAAAPLTMHTHSPLVPTTWRVVRRVPRPRGCFTQGLFFRGRELYESCGMRGASVVRRSSLAGGVARELASAANPASDFGEGLALWPPALEAEHAAAAAAAAAPAPARAAALPPRLLQLTWQERDVVVWDADSLAPVERVRFSSTTDEGWGLTHDGASELIMSDGSARLHFWSPAPDAYRARGAMVPLRDAVAVVDRVRGAADGWLPPGGAPPPPPPPPSGGAWAPQGLVRPQHRAGLKAGAAIPALNELEFAHGWVLANIWYDARVAIIHPRSGAAVWYLDFSELLRENSDGDVLNGLAYTLRLDVAQPEGAPPLAAPLATEAWGGRLWVTGKWWTNIYEIELAGLVNATDLADLGNAAGTGVRSRGRAAVGARH